MHHGRGSSPVLWVRARAGDMVVEARWEAGQRRVQIGESCAGRDRAPAAYRRRPEVFGGTPWPQAAFRLGGRLRPCSAPGLGRGRGELAEDLTGVGGQRVAMAVQDLPFAI